jgi:hypothetical protein
LRKRSRRSEKVDNLENIVNKMQSDAEMKYTRTVEKERAYCDGYKQGIEDLYAYIYDGVKRLKRTAEHGLKCRCSDLTVL